MNGNVLMRIYNASDPATGETTLHNYCKYINSAPTEVFKYMIAVKGFNLHTTNESNQTPLLVALDD